MSTDRQALHNLAARVQQRHCGMGDRSAYLLAVNVLNLLGNPDDEVLSGRERGYQQAIDHLRQEADERREKDGNPTMWAVFTAAAAFLEARRGDEEHRPAARTWALPTIPEDVKAVRDADGMIWYRHRHGPGWWNEDGDRLPTAQLLAAGKVTEVLSGEFEEPEVLEDNRG